RERDQRSRGGRPARHVRRRTQRRTNARGDGRTGTENLGVDVAFSNAPACEAKGQIAHEGRRSADIEVGVARPPQLLERTDVQASASIEILAWPILGTGRAVADVAAAMRQGFKKA